MNGWTRWTMVRTRSALLAWCLVCVSGFVGTTCAAGQYLKVDYPASTAADELQVPVTYTLWIPDGVS